jgi:hypothetical protein
MFQVNSENLEVNIHLLAYLNGLLESKIVDLDGLFLVAYRSTDEVSLGQDSIANLDVSKILLSIFNLVIQFLQFFLVVLLLLNLHLKYF